MVVQVFEPEHKKATFAQKLAGGLDKALPMAYQLQQEAKAKKLQSEEKNALGTYLESLGVENARQFPVEAQQKIAEQFARQNAKFQNLDKLGLGDLFGGNQPDMNDQFEPSNEMPDEVSPTGVTDMGKVGLGSRGSNREIPETKILQAEALGQHGIAQQMRAHNDRIIDEKKTNRAIFNEDRKYHTKFSELAEKEAEDLRQSIPKKEMALQFARDAVQSGNLGYFSADKLADATGIDLFRTSKGAQLTTAAKENLLSNMSRVGAKAQNIWFEQRLNSMFAKIGQSEEANLTVQEMLEGEVALDKAYLEEFDKISQRDMQDYGYVRKDASKRAHDAVRPIEKDIMRRTSFRMKEIEEKEKGLKSLEKDVNLKSVPKGTPLTMQMLGLYIEKFGKDNAIKVAEKKGYYVPSYEEWQRFNQGSFNE